MSQGDPQLVAAPVFTIGSIALACQLVQIVSPGALGAPLAIILMCTGVFLLVATIWAAAVGQSFVACFAGTFGGFWLAYGVLVLGLLHNWFLIPPKDVANTVAIFAISFAAFFLFLTLASIRRGVAQAGSIGYWMGAPYVRYGHMTAAVRAVLPFAFGTLRLHRVEAACIPTNTPSIRLLERCGFSREGYARQYLCINGIWQDHLLFARLKDDPQ